MENENYSGTLRITNINTLERWLKNGEYQKLVDAGYVYNVGCGRFRNEDCKCSVCVRKSRTQQLLDLEERLLNDGYKTWCYVMLNVSDIMRRALAKKQPKTKPVTEA